MGRNTSILLFCNQFDFNQTSFKEDKLLCLFMTMSLSVAYVTLSCTFRYGRDDMDVMGIAFRRDIHLSTRQVYPPLQDKEQCTLTKVQEKLLRKLGYDAYPFFFEVSTDLKTPSFYQKVLNV